MKILNLSKIKAESPRSGSSSHSLKKKPIVAGYKGVDVEVLEVDPKGGISKHEADAQELIYFQTGSGKVWLEGDEYALKPGDAVQVEKGQQFGFEATEPTTAVLIKVD